jgi:hypothetical protein
MDETEFEHGPYNYEALAFAELERYCREEL